MQLKILKYCLDIQSIIEEIETIKKLANNSFDKKFKV